MVGAGRCLRRTLRPADRPRALCEVAGQATPVHAGGLAARGPEASGSAVPSTAAGGCSPGATTGRGQRAAAGPGGLEPRSRYSWGGVAGPRSRGRGQPPGGGGPRPRHLGRGRRGGGSGGASEDGVRGGVAGAVPAPAAPFAAALGRGRRRFPGREVVPCRLLTADRVPQDHDGEGRARAVGQRQQPASDPGHQQVLQDLHGQGGPRGRTGGGHEQ
mmetsp:Transcript_97674/g.315356  ORF Transcript_97674/g.315356 Transcript_97674/m.315356 type:complete len:216 (+) Transcript_97674:311-958(+)